jgi:Flp pilus assembly protein TadG
MRTSRHRSRESGGAAVEFALVLPIFMLLVMGALDYGYFFFSEQVVAGAAREGARTGTMDAFANAANTAKQAATDFMKGNGIACPAAEPDCINTSTSVVTINAVNYNRVVVDIHYAFKSLTGYSSIVIPAQIKGYAEMRW